MSFRSQRRRRKQALDGPPELESGQEVMVVSGIRGQNLYDLRSASGTEAVFELPKKLRNVVMIRVGTYVFARPDTTRRVGAVQGDIEAVVLHQHLAELRRASFWPIQFSKAQAQVHAQDTPPKDDGEPNAVGDGNKNANASNTVDSSSETETTEDWIAQGNPNRASWAQFDPSSSESEAE